MLDLVRLLDLDANAHTVYTGLNKHPFILISSNRERGQENFWGCLRFDFRNIVSLGGLGREVGEAQC